MSFPGPGFGRLAGTVSLVTGAGSVGPGWGNGRAAAALFAREGSRVIAVDVDAGAVARTVDPIIAGGGQARAVLCDVTDDDAVADLVEDVIAHEGAIDILVNNVGGSRPGGPIELAPEDWHLQLQLNLTSAYLLCHHVLPTMVANGGGVVVNTSSTSGLRFTGSPQVGYAAAKAGVIQLSKVIAVQHAADGIRANTVVPGQLHTPMVEARLAGQRSGGDVDALLATRQARVPLGFVGDGRDTAWAALFLASSEARFITGTEIIVDGGMTARCD